MATEKFSRRNLPHWYVPGAAHFVTYRLFGSLPRQVLDQLDDTRAALLKQQVPRAMTPLQHRTRLHKQLFAAYDQALDRGAGPAYLADPRVASIVRSNLYHHDGTKYRLLAYCVMSNHVHVLFIPNEEVEQASRLLYVSGEVPIGEQPDEGSPLSRIMHSLKSYTAHEANKLLQRTGSFWQAESYDHWVRDEAELERIIEYIAANPVKAGLVQEPQSWKFSSSHDRYLKDRALSGCLW